MSDSDTIKKRVSRKISKVCKHIETPMMDEVTAFSEATKIYVDLYKNIPNIHEYKFNMEFIKSVCNAVENIYIDGEFKKSKKEHAINMITTCMSSRSINYGPEDLKILDGIIDGLHAMGQFNKITKTNKRIRKVMDFFSLLPFPK
jgi:hypothetical protein